MSLTPQASTVLNHLKRVGNISSVEAHSVHRIRSLSRRITEVGRHLFSNPLVLHGQTFDGIDREFKKDVLGQRYVRYSLRPRKVLAVAPRDSGSAFGFSAR